MSPGFREAHPEIPWISIIGMRNILVHGYRETDLEAVWLAATADVPALLSKLEKVVPLLAPDQESGNAAAEEPLQDRGDSTEETAR